MAGLSAAALLSAGHTKERFGPSVEAPEWDEIATVTAGAEVDVWIVEVDQGLIDPSESPGCHTLLCFGHLLALDGVYARNPADRCLVEFDGVALS